ncbi:MAG: flavohemoglobin expression-modulating motif protein [Cellvibrio sp.]|nr:flavohemoglobin expression-modulating motif protein [Cellvibrio sp.]
MTDPLYLERLKQLSTRLVSLQKPIRILDAIKWPQGIEQRFREHQGKELPALGADFYQRQPLAFEPGTVSQLLKELKESSLSYCVIAAPTSLAISVANSMARRAITCAAIARPCAKWASACAIFFRCQR